MRDLTAYQAETLDRVRAGYARTGRPIEAHAFNALVAAGHLRVTCAFPLAVTPKDPRRNP